MSSRIKAATRRRTCLFASTLLAPVLSLGISSAKAQQASPGQLPPIQVSPPVDETRTRAKPISDDGYGPPRVAPSTSPPGNPNPSPTREPTPVRQFAGIVCASTTVITAEDIARSPAHTLPEIIGQTPGVQLTSLYGGLNGAGTSVDLRGFGAFATANTLLLINGRRVNDIDLQGGDFSTR